MRGQNFLANMVGNQAANQFLMMTGQANDAQVQQAALQMGQQWSQLTFQFSQQLEANYQQLQDTYNIIQRLKEGELSLKDIKVSQDGVEIVPSRPPRKKEDD